MLANRPIPTAKEIAAATATTDSIHIFSDESIPGTISMVTTERTKKTVETVAEIQYVQERLDSMAEGKSSETA